MITAGKLSYPPLSTKRKLSWTALEDQARLAVAAHETDRAIGETFDIATPEAVTGDELAALISKKINREIRAAPLSPDEFAARMSPVYGEQTSRMIAELYAATDSLPEDGAVVDTNRVLSVLPVQLTTVSDWIANQNWNL